MRKRDLVDGVVGPRLEETLDQIFCMKGMTTAEKVDFLMSRNRELRADNERLREQGARLFDKTLEVGTENAQLRELVRDMWNEGMCECGSLGKCANCIYDYPSRLRELGIEVE